MAKKDDRKNKFPVKTRSSACQPIDYEIITDEVSDLTKDKAYQFLELKTFDGERNVRERHVQHLFDEYNAGRFLWHHVLIGSAVLGADEYRINGQHTCWMRVNIPENQKVEAECRFVKYKVNTGEDLRALYSAFDRGAPRTVGHVSNVMLMDTAAGRQLPKYIISQLVSGFRIFFAEDWRTANSDVNELVGIITNNYAEVFNVVGHFLNNRRDEHVAFRRACVAAGMLATFEKNVQKAVEFWDPVTTGLGLTEKSDPRHQLRQYLTTHGQSIVGGLIKTSAEDMYRVEINMWNKWRRGEPVKAVQMLDKRVKPV